MKIKIINAITGNIIGVAYTAIEALEKAEKSAQPYRLEVEEIIA